MLVASFGGVGMVAPVRVASRRVFAGSWEYLIEQAIFTAPPHPAWSGAALINREAKLVGVGSLIVGDATGNKDNSPGNMFVPIDLLMPILGDLLANGRVSGPGKPWLGVSADEVAGRLFVSRVTPESPAEKAGIKRGDIVVGIGGEATKTLPEFYKKLWSLGPAGVNVPLDVVQGGNTPPHRHSVGPPARSSQTKVDLLGAAIFVHQTGTFRPISGWFCRISTLYPCT